MMKGLPIKVMIVDDQAIIRRGIKAFLRGFKDISVVGEATNGLQAAGIAEQLKPDIVLLDLLMPGIDGIETIKRILAVQPYQHIIVLTAYFQDDKILQAVNAGASGYVRKDSQPRELVHSIQQVFGGQKAIDGSLSPSLL